MGKDNLLLRAQHKLVVLHELEEPLFDGQGTVYCPPELATFFTEYLGNSEGWADMKGFLWGLVGKLPDSKSVTVCVGPRGM